MKNADEVVMEKKQDAQTIIITDSLQTVKCWANKGLASIVLKDFHQKGVCPTS